MTVWSGLDVARFWTGAGGPANRAVEWVAISLGESSWDDQAVSPAGAIGLWQIMPFNAAPNGVTVAQLYDPSYNALVAVLMSGGGTNCAAWDSCYVDIEATGRLTFLGYPEVGSADYNNLPIAQAAVSGHGYGGLTDPGSPGVPDPLVNGITGIQLIAGTYIPAVTAAMLKTNAAAARIGTRGWTP